MPARVSSVQQGASVKLLGSIHPFPSKEFFPECCVSLGFLHFLFLSSFQSIFPWFMGCASCSALCPPHTGGPHASPLPGCSTARGNPALGAAGELSSHPQPVLGSPSSQHTCRAEHPLVGSTAVLASRASAKGLMLPRSTRGCSQSLSQTGWGLAVHPQVGVYAVGLLASHC